MPSNLGDPKAMVEIGTKSGIIAELMGGLKSVGPLATLLFGFCQFGIGVGEFSMPIRSHRPMRGIVRCDAGH